MTGDPLHASACVCRTCYREIGMLAAYSHPTSALCNLSAGVATSKCGAGGVAESTTVWSGAGVEGREVMSACSSASCPSRPEIQVVNCVRSSVSFYLSVATVAWVVSSSLCRQITLVCEMCSSCVRHATRSGRRGAGSGAVGVSS